MFERFAPDAERALERARLAAAAERADAVTPTHLLLGVLECAVAGQVFARLGANPLAVRGGLLRASGGGARAARVAPGADPEELPFDDTARDVLEGSVEEVVGFGHREIGCGHLLIALAKEDDDPAGQALAAAGADVDTLRLWVLDCLAEQDDAA